MSDRRCALLVGAVLLGSYAYFYQAGGWNQNSRFALVRALVEKHSIAIDDYQQATGDKARHAGHFYTDKAPGQSFLAAPGVALARLFFAAPNSPRALGALSYLATVLTSALPTLLAALALFGLARRLGASQGAAALGALVFGLGTPAWAYATVFMGHALTGACLMLALYFAYRLGDASRPGEAGPRAGEDVTPRRALAFAVGVGLCGGWAVLTEYPAAPAVLILAGYALWRARSRGRRALVCALLGMSASGLVCATLLLAYQKAAFGSVFATPLQHLVLFTNVRERPFGWPRVGALGEILFGLRRGLLPLAPILLVTPWGLWLWWRQHRALAVAAASVIVCYLLVNAAFATPLGGWSYGPRYIGAALPFFCLAIPAVWDRLTRSGRFVRPLARGVFVAVAALGMAMTFVAVSTTVQPPESFARPMSQLLLPAFGDGDLMLNHQSFWVAAAHEGRLRGGSLPHAAWNLGELVGLRGHVSLAPLVLFWGGVALWVGYGAGKRARSAAPTT